MQLAPQTVDKLQNAAGFGFHDRLHYQLATATEDSDHHRFLVHVHADILDLATHAVASLGERSFAFNGALSLKVECDSPADLPTWSFRSALPHYVYGPSLIMHWPSQVVVGDMAIY